jgi:Ala-tRNA(Pro) deacylase
VLQLRPHVRGEPSLGEQAIEKADCGILRTFPASLVVLSTGCAGCVSIPDVVWVHADAPHAFARQRVGMSGTLDPQHHSALAGHGVRAVQQHLDAHGVVYEVVEHRPTETAGEEARAVHVEATHMAKTVVVREGSALVLAVVPASRRVDVEKLQVVLGAPTPPRFATEHEIADRFPSVDVGAVPPVGVLAAAVVLDTSLLEHPQIVIAGGDHRHAVKLDPRDVQRLSDAKVASIS